jgi:hypothetical protein
MTTRSSTRVKAGEVLDEVKVEGEEALLFSVSMDLVERLGAEDIVGFRLLYLDLKITLFIMCLL